MSPALEVWKDKPRARKHIFSEGAGFWTCKSLGENFPRDVTYKAFNKQSPWFWKHFFRHETKHGTCGFDCLTLLSMLLEKLLNIPMTPVITPITFWPRARAKTYATSKEWFNDSKRLLRPRWQTKEKGQAPYNIPNRRINVFLVFASFQDEWGFVILVFW